MNIIIDNIIITGLNSFINTINGNISPELLILLVLFVLKQHYHYV